MASWAMAARADRVLELTRQLLAYATEQRDAIGRGTLHQLDWLSERTEELAAELRRLSEGVQLEPVQLAELLRLAEQFQAVKRESETGLATLRMQPAEPADNHEAAALCFTEGNRLHAECRYPAAAAAYHAALELQADNADAHNNLGNTLQRLERYDEAIAHYRAALALRPSLADTYNNLGNALHAVHRTDEAARQFEIALTLRPEFAEAHNNAGNALRALGRADEAVAHYRQALALAPGYPEAHNNLANALLAAHHYDEALAEYAQAIALRPEYAVAHNNVGTALQELGRFEEAAAHYETALRIEPGRELAHRALATLLTQLGDMEAARRHAPAGFRRRVDVFPYRGSARPLRVLVLQSALGGAVITDRWLDDHVFAKTTLVVDFAEASLPLPAHDAILNAIGEADRCKSALEAATALLAGARAQVINAPESVLATGRVETSERLGRLPGVATPRIARLPRATLAGERGVRELENQGFAWPLLLRSPGFHTGENFVLVERPADTASAAMALPGPDLFAIEFLDTRGTDGKFRKCRVLFVDGQLYPLHLAISANWKVHYFSADMAENAAHRAEDAAFLRDMQAAVGAPGVVALEAIRDELALDYAGVDFGLNANGDLVVFEANATMVVPPAPPDAQWAYRRAAADRVNQAATDMIAARARLGAAWRAA